MTVAGNDVGDLVGTSRRAAFFDVDETLIDVKSMFDFLEFYLERRGEPAGTYHRLAATLRARAERGETREGVNRAYYALLADESWARLRSAGREWFDALLQRDPFIPATRAMLDCHSRAGDYIALLSGSFAACLDPLAAHVGADDVFCSRPVVHEGRLTGAVLEPMVGRAKARKAREAAARRDLDLSISSAYGDHSSDMDLLCSVGRPVVIGSDPILLARARRNRWTVFSRDELTA